MRPAVADMPFASLKKFLEDVWFESLGHFLFVVWLAQ
jgi:hypothetical protein